MADDQQTKTEQPTPFRLQEARERGQVARSAEVAGVVVAIVFTIALLVSVRAIAVAFARSVGQTILMAGNAPALTASLAAWLQKTFQPAWQAILPVMVAMLVAAVVGNLMQTGPTFSTTPIKPDFSRLNPAQGAKRLFSLRLLWELFKLILKLVLLGALGWFLAKDIDDRVQSASFIAPPSIGELLRSTYAQVATWVLVVLALMALFDWWFTHREYMRKLRMSHRDIKDEVKRREGDPDIRQKRKRLMSELVKRARSVSRVPDADIVLTNPTHLAVALKYRPKSMRAPVVLAKGSDKMAAHIRMVAARSGVPCLRSPELARALFRECKVDRAVPSHLFKSLSPVYRWLMKCPGNRIFS